MTIEQELAALRGGAPEKSPSVRTLAGFARHCDCAVSNLALATRTDLDTLLKGTDFEVKSGQDPQAFLRGNKFEQIVKDMDCAALLKLLREKAGFSITEARLANLRVGSAPNLQGLKRRAFRTRMELKKIVSGRKDAYNILDGAVLSCHIAGRIAYFETDGLAATFAGKIHPIEVKSFPCTDGRCDSEKLGAACDQAAWYALLVRLTLLDLGLRADAVSDNGFIVLPEGVGLAPTLLVQNLSTRIGRAGRLLALAPKGAEILRFASGLHFPSDQEQAQKRVNALENIMDTAGTAYHPDCLQDCGMARLCRFRAQNIGHPSMCGSHVMRFLPGVLSLQRAIELASGEKPAQAESHAAAALVRAKTVYDRVLSKGTI
ncbi:hypothetical protein [Paraburkholderia youngii]|uniref:hypothetical protein n=1 Tax=Paraburkholderia youngii TaxID=2782701 RepID=UPI003D238BBB